MLSLLVLDLATGEFMNPRASSNREIGFNLLTTIIPFALRALLVVTMGWGIVRLFPHGKDVLAHVPLWPMFFVILIVDDYINYWLHRTSHQRPVLWRLHKPHHTPTYLNVLMASRENKFYYFPIPAAWMAPVMIYASAGAASALVFGFKGVVTLLQHTGFRWDLRLRRYVAGRLLLDVVEKIVVLQDFHHVHHGIGRYNNASSNYGDTLCVWDVLHGTAYGQRQGKTPLAWPWERRSKPVWCNCSGLWFGQSASK
ncbi:sterol desaturase family protein [Paraburkholderia panacisoli]|jgi:sterol desaturase/sphingolipid hydroxylase (fatty acid hydroxylase superfamily)|uniref:Sterol desaturase family protein n=1 Tax=Paraburkholderia panacisoli TaxID=2603818 RepID=A0A5B0HHT3_9BURK|nr:sterol desaturase family protein [Paraburkholderia panacisoli]KAA1014433.1 sterol desaturase family protein [Paraburkholderia panacisoli]